MTGAIIAVPQVVATEIANTILSKSPTQLQVQQLRSDLLRRHLSLRGLKPTVSSEEIVEAYYRCVLTERLMKAHGLTPATVPTCINSSHRAVRRVCVSPEHNHSSIKDQSWTKGWAHMRQTPGVDIRKGASRAACHADLYVLASEQIVSIEFKYLNAVGLQDVAGCAAQLTLHARHHSEALLLLYSGAGTGVLGVARQLRTIVEAENTRIMSVSGPEITKVTQAA